MYAFAPDVQIGRAQTWNIGLQRAITKDMAVEIRYVGTKGTNQWSELDWNAIRGENLVANGFMNEANTSNYDGQWGNGTDTAKAKFDNAHGLTPSPPTDCGAKSWESLLNGWKW